MLELPFPFHMEDVREEYNKLNYNGRLMFIQELGYDKDELIKDGVVDGNLFVTRKWTQLRRKKEN